MDFYSVQQVAERLGLQAKTVRGYVREGKLKAVRIGKQYRIASTDLAGLTGQAVAAVQPAPPTETSSHADVSSVVQIDLIGFDAAGRITTALMASTNGPRGDRPPLRIDTIYDRERWRLKIILTGDIETTSSLLRFIAACVKN